jgi:hypothetical protein
MTDENKAARDLLKILLRRDGQLAISEDGERELAERGIEVPEAAIVSLIPEETLVVCMYATAPLLMPGNRLGRCSGCGARIQCRPYIPTTATLICAPCGLQLVRMN